MSKDCKKYLAHTTGKEGVNLRCYLRALDQQGQNITIEKQDSLTRDHCFRGHGCTLISTKDKPKDKSKSCSDGS